jgi:hypothetical protein
MNTPDHKSHGVVKQDPNKFQNGRTGLAGGTTGKKSTAQPNGKDSDDLNGGSGGGTSGTGGVGGTGGSVL